MRVGPEVTGKRVTWLARRAAVPSGVYWIVWIHWIVWSLYVCIAGIRVRSDNGSQNVDRGNLLVSEGVRHGERGGGTGAAPLCGLADDNRCPMIVLGRSALGVHGVISLIGEKDYDRAVE